MIPAIAPPPGDVLGLKERNIHDWWSPADDPFMPREVFRGAHLHKRHRWRCIRQQCPAGRPSACISTSSFAKNILYIYIIYMYIYYTFFFFVVHILYTAKIAWIVLKCAHISLKSQQEDIYFWSSRAFKTTYSTDLMKQIKTRAVRLKERLKTGCKDVLLKLAQTVKLNEIWLPPVSGMFSVSVPPGLDSASISPAFKTKNRCVRTVKMYLGPVSGRLTFKSNALQYWVTP